MLACLQQVMADAGSLVSKLKLAARSFADPILLVLCLGGAVRNGAGIVWAYNSVNFFEQYQPDVDVRTEQTLQ